MAFYRVGVAEDAAGFGGPVAGAIASLRPLPLGSTLTEINSLEGLEALEYEWLDLENGGASSHSVFQSFEWCRAWARVYAHDGNHLSILAGRHSGRLVFVLPLMKKRDGAVTTLCWLTDPLGQYGDLLIAPDQSPERWMQRAWAQIKTMKGVDSVRLRHVRADALITPFLAREFRSAKAKHGAPALDLTQYADEEAYDARYSKEQRRRRKRIRKDLEEQGAVAFNLLEGQDMDRAMADALREKQKWAGDRGLWSKALGCPLLIDFLTELRAASGRNLRLVTSHMTAGGSPVSWEIGLRFKSRHCGFLTAHSTDLTDSSPARLHMDLSQRRALADGMKVFDLMVPNDPYKESWSSGVTVIEDYYAPLSWKGFLHGVVYLETLRPVLRKLYYTAPAPVRHVLTGVARLKHLIAR